MKIDWAALGIVAVVAIGATVVFTLLLAAGIRFVATAQLRTNQGTPATGVRSAGYSMIALAGLLVLFGLYVIVPQFH
jgi:hypothetical protein